MSFWQTDSSYVAHPRSGHYYVCLCGALVGAWRRCALPPWTHLCCDACCSPDTSAADAAVLSLYLPHAFPSSQCSVWSHWRVLHFSPAPYPLFLPIHGILYCNSLGVSMGVQYGHLFLSLPDFWAVLILLGSARWRLNSISKLVLDITQSKLTGGHRW